MDRDQDTLQLRVERRLRLYQALAAALGLVFLVSAMARQETAAAPDDGMLRVRGIVVEDSEGVARAVLGPLPTPKGFDARKSPAVGLVLNDSNGYERFGLGLSDDGNVSMGFDAAPDAGDPRNPERINLIVGPDGESVLRFLNGETQVVGMLRVNAEGEFCFEFVDWKTDKILRRQLRFGGEQTIEWK